MVAPDHRRPAFGRDGVEFLLAHPQAILDAAARTGRYDDMTVVALRIR